MLEREREREREREIACAQIGERESGAIYLVTGYKICHRNLGFTSRL